MGSTSSDSEDERKHRKRKKKDKKVKKSKKEKKQRKEKKHKRHRRPRSSSNSSESESDEWVEALPQTTSQSSTDKECPPKALQTTLEREDWMSATLIPTYSREPKREEKKQLPSNQYDPKTSVRELNPHWKNGGTGLPTFRKPANDDDDQIVEYRRGTSETKLQNKTGSAGWKKSSEEKQSSAQSEHVVGRYQQAEKSTNIEVKSEQVDEEFLTDEQLNDLGAKIIKAELLGNAVQAESLKLKLERAKIHRNEIQLKISKDKAGNVSGPKRKMSTDETVTYTTNQRPRGSQRNESRESKRFQQCLPPGSDLGDKFRSERYENDNMDAQFFKVSSKMGEGRKLENIFDHQKASSSVGDSTTIENSAVRDMNRMNKTQANCERCLSSSKFGHEQVISVGKHVYLCLPTWRGLQPKHCFIVPISHYPCLTQVDEDVHQEIVDVCKALVQMFRKHHMEVVFFETVRYLNRNPHMYIQCVPATDYEMAPFYFKKAILESETEWVMNKKLHNVDGFNVRRTIPKGLPYFWVNFNMEHGFAHVIEDQEVFPVTFATETIAGILGLDTRDWRKPRKELNPVQKVDEFKHWWKDFAAVVDMK